MIPGDPVDLMLGETASEEQRKELREALHLDGPILTLYFDYLKNLVVLDFGNSLFSNKPVFALIKARMPATIELSIFSIFLALLWSIPLGISTASTKSRFLDFLGTSAGVVCMSLPGYFLGPMLIWVFAVILGILPVGERGGFDHLILPGISLALPLGAILMRMTRASVKEVMTEDYIRVAYSKGISRNSLYYRHALSNSMISIVTIVGLQIGTLLTGTVITETIFNWPGIGTLLFEAIQQRDYPIVQGCIIIIASIYVFINFLTDLTYGLVDPRIRLK